MNAKFTKERMKILLMYSLPSILLIFSSFIFLSVIPFVVILLMIFLGLIIIVIMFVQLFKLLKHYRYEIFKSIFSNYYQDFYISTGRGIRKQKVINSKLFVFDDFFSFDLMTAKYNQYPVQISEILLQTKTETKVNIVCKGLFAEIILKKFDQTVLIVVPKNSNKYSYIKIESHSKQFNEIYDCYASEKEMQNLLTPYLINRFLKLSENKQIKVFMSYIMGSLFICTHNRRDYFELHLLKKIPEEALITFEHEVKIVNDILKEFSNNIV